MDYGYAALNKLREDMLNVMFDAHLNSQILLKVKLQISSPLTLNEKKEVSSIITQYFTSAENADFDREKWRK